MQRNFVIQILLTFFYFLILTLLKWGFNVSFSCFFFIFGGVLGSFLLSLDYYLYAFFTKPEDLLSQKAREFFRQKNYGGVMGVIEEIRNSREDFVLHGVIFGGVLLILSLFAVTSSGSLLGMGIALGIYLRYLLDCQALFKKNPLRLNTILFKQTGRVVDIKYQNYVLLFLLGGFLLTSGLFLK